MKKISILLLLAMTLSMGSCTVRLVDFTVISSKNVNMNLDVTQGKQVEGKKGYFLGIGFNLKDAMDRALENAGPGYDLLVDGVVSYTPYPFVTSVKVKGTAINSTKMRMSMSEEEYNKWYASLNILDPSTAEIEVED